MDIKTKNEMPMRKNLTLPLKIGYHFVQGYTEGSHADSRKSNKSRKSF